VLANDTDCEGNLTVTIISGPTHGTASVLGGREVVYNPNHNFSGLDSIWYKDTNGNGDTADALLVIYVSNNTSISSVNEVALQLYPVPATDELNVQFENPGKCEAYIYDMSGKLVRGFELNENNNHLSLDGLSNGFYTIQIADKQGNAIARGRFTVLK
jgi:hypothetical protein